MFLSVYTFLGDPAALLEGYEKLLRAIPPANLQLHACVPVPQGIEVYDTCPTREIARRFVASVEFRAALREAGLPPPTFTPIGEIHTAFAGGRRLA